VSKSDTERRPKPVVKLIAVVLTLLVFIAAGYGLAFLIFMLLGVKLATIVAGPVACCTFALGLVVAVRIEKHMAGKGF
jgi:hypothetical protein